MARITWDDLTPAQDRAVASLDTLVRDWYFARRNKGDDHSTAMRHARNADKTSEAFMGLVTADDGRSFFGLVFQSPEGDLFIRTGQNQGRYGVVAVEDVLDVQVAVSK